MCVGSTLASGWEVREKEKVSSTVLVISWADSLTIYHKRVLNGQQKHNLFSLEATHMNGSPNKTLLFLFMPLLLTPLELALTNPIYSNVFCIKGNKHSSPSVLF